MKRSLERGEQFYGTPCKARSISTGQNMGKTRGVHETTPEIRNRMVGMYEAGLGLKEIAAAVNCSQRTVKRWLNRFDREGNVDTRERCGRKRATTHEEDEAIVRLATQTPITAAKAVLPALGLNCSVDTVRERLHKAGIHNWSPSKKHIQKIPITAADGAGIQQAVWRPTGTQLGKKKLTKEPVKSKASSPLAKKKKRAARPRKAKSKKAFEEDGAPSDTADQSEVQQPNFSFPTPAPNELTTPPMNEMQALPPPPATLPPPAPQPQPPPPATHSVIPSNSNHYSHPLNLIPQSQPIYHHHHHHHHHHPGLDVSQNWPLDLVQGAHHYATQTQQTAIHHEQHHGPMHIQSHPQIISHHDTQLPHHMHDQIEASIHPQPCELTHQKLDNHRINVENPQDLAQGEFSQSEDGISNACIDVCSNSNASSNGNSQNSSVDDDMSSDNNSSSSPRKSRKMSKSKKKKGGKIKGTLETSVEMRNRMIGMSEAGLSTLSIALAINRSERTVKRWLDRWHKEGNVQTKERKGRRRITTKEEDDAIIALATQQPLTAAKNVAPALGLKCSVDTIRERLHKAGIHSWKLGKKQGIGNAVHTVHLWQPSGNRSNKLKAGGNKRRKTANKKRNRNADDSSKQSSKKASDETPPEISPSTTTVIHQEPSLQFQNPSQSPSMMPSTHELSSTTSEFIQPRQHMQAPPMCTQGSLPPQSLQAMGPIMQPRSDCRLSLSALAPSIPSQASANISYSSCMLGNNNHATHMEQADPMNYEPYIWSF